jgi:RNA polymerase-binding transcription factor
MESERANELEERAQEARATRMFARLDDHRKQEIDEIDRALQRLTLGTYGIRIRCGEPIPLPRLRALPTALVHVQCTAEEELGPPIMTEEEQPLPVEEAETLISSGQADEPPEDLESVGAQVLRHEC